MPDCKIDIRLVGLGLNSNDGMNGCPTLNMSTARIFPNNPFSGDPVAHTNYVHTHDATQIYSPGSGTDYVQDCHNDYRSPEPGGGLLAVSTF